MKRIIIVLSAVFFITGISSAEACYTAADFEAEQGVRIHSELMVIGLTCMKMPEGPALYRKYQDFSSKNADLLAEYEEDLIQHYTKEGASAPEEKFHALRTNLANDISRRAINMSMLSFCQQFSPRIDQALEMDQQKVRRWAQHVWPDQAPTEPMCSNELTHGQM